MNMPTKIIQFFFSVSTFYLLSHFSLYLTNAVKQVEGEARTGT